MIMTGDPIDAARALAWGLVSEVVSQGGPSGPRARHRQDLASRAPIAAETAKLNLRAALSMPLEKAIEYERDLQTICFATRTPPRAAPPSRKSGRPFSGGDEPTKRGERPTAGWRALDSLTSLSREQVIER